MTFRLICQDCQRKYDPASLVWRCACGGLLDPAEFPIRLLPLEQIRQRPATLWRYREALPCAPGYDGWQALTMGEGLTPLVPLAAETPTLFTGDPFSAEARERVVFPLCGAGLKAA